MSLICRTKTFLKTAVNGGSLCTFSISAGLLLGFAAVANAMVVPAIPYTQEIEEEDIQVKVHQLESDDGKQIEVVVVADDGEDHQELAKKIKLKHLDQVQSDGENVEVEVLVHDEDATSSQKDVLKKLKSKLNGRLHKIIANPDENIEVVVLDELSEKHKPHFHKLHGDADGKNNVFVFEADDKHGGHLHLHEHLTEILHSPTSGKMSRKALAKKLRQLADQIEAKDKEQGATQKTNRKIKVLASGDHELHFEEEGKSNNKSHEAFEFTTDSGQHIVIGKPGHSKSMVIEVQSAEDAKPHSHESGKKKIHWHGKKSPDAAKNIFVEKIQTDGGHDPKELAHKILGKLKSGDSHHNIVVEKILGKNKPDQKAHGSNTFTWKSAPSGIESSIQELKKELKELRRELKDLKADRNRD